MGWAFDCQDNAATYMATVNKAQKFGAAGSMTGAGMTIQLNGAPHDCAAGTSIAGLVLALGLDPARVAVERNRAIVPRSTLATVLLSDGDELEIVHFVGGG